MDETPRARMGISAIATYEPPWVLGNDWFGETIPRKFVHHTGIESRPISLEDEVTMGYRVVRNLQREVGSDLNDCLRARRAAHVLGHPGRVAAQPHDGLTWGRAVCAGRRRSCGKRGQTGGRSHSRGSHPSPAAVVS